MARKHAVILGAGSDIGSRIAACLSADGWQVSPLRHADWLTVATWDLVVCCYGTLEPIGSFWDVDLDEWGKALHINALLPLQQIHELYPYARTGASVCFFSGAGANGPAPTYSAYAASKIMLTKMVELLDAESPDTKFFILGPGMVRTKIQEQTLRAGKRAANFDRVSAFMNSESQGTSMENIYACLMACVNAPKAAIGGRNVYVPLDDWTQLEKLTGDQNTWKLRRAGDETLRRSR